MRKIIFFVIPILLFSCSQTETKTEDTALKTDVKTDSIETDISDCWTHLEDVELLEGVLADQFIHPSQFAITFYDNYKAVKMYDKDGSRDSLPEHLQNPNRQAIYNSYDAFGCFGTYIQPTLDTLKIRTFKSFQLEEIISFNGTAASYFVDTKQFEKTDGTLIFNGQDAPKFVYHLGKSDCNLSQQIESYFNRYEPLDSNAIWQKQSLAEKRAFDNYWKNKNEPEYFPHGSGERIIVYHCEGRGDWSGTWQMRRSSGQEISKGDFKDYCEIVTTQSSYNQTTAACFDPKISIVVYDAKGVPISFSEVCFDCNSVHSNPGRPPFKIIDSDFYGLSKKS